MMAALRWCFSCFMSDSSAHIPLKEMPVVQLDTQNMGCDVVVVKSGRRICGTGACLANAPLHQNKSYFEFKVQSTGDQCFYEDHATHDRQMEAEPGPDLSSVEGVWGVGVATRKVDLSRVPLGGDTESLVLRHDGTLSHRSEECNRLPANSLPQEGDVIGITYDHVEMSVYVNGKNTHCSASGIRGTVYPVVYVDDSAILDCQFSDFYHSPPLGFEKIMFEQQIF